MSALLALSMFAAAASSSDVPKETCELVVYNSGATYTVASSVNVAAHLKFPKNIDVINTSLSTKLWNITHDGSDLWVRGLDTETAAARVGVTVKFEDETTVTLIVENHVAPPPCYRFWHEGAVRTALGASEELERAMKAAEEQKAAALDAQRQYLKKAVELNETYKQALERAQLQLELSTNDAIEDFKERIYTAYAIEATSSNDFHVTAAYDDGIFTYIRIDSQAFGVPALSKRRGEETLIVDHSFNDLNNVYSVPGLHRELALELEGQTVIIRRVN